MIDVKAKINNFFIFNSTLGPIEGEELKKILFFYPSQSSSDERKIQVGLCEAVVKFMSTFSSQPCEALQTQTKRHILYQPEKDFWMVLVVKIPYATKAVANGSEARNEMVEPTIMHDFLVSAYKTFKMFLGNFADIPCEELYDKCEQFFTPYIASRNLINDMSNVIQGVNYLALDKISFLQVLTFIDLVEVNCPKFKCISFIYNDQLVWNALSTDDMLTLYMYLVQSLIPEQVDRELRGGAAAAAERHGRFVCPDGVRSEQDLRRVTRVHARLEGHAEARQWWLVVYRTLSATVSFAVDLSTELDLESFRALDAFIGPRLSAIASAVSEPAAALAAHALAHADTKYLYYNRLNLAFKTSPPPAKLAPSAAVKPEVLSIIAGIHADKDSLGNYGEIIIKTPDEYWITGKCSNEREFYVVIQQRGANIKEISDEVKRICEAQLKGIFFYPI